MEEAQERKKRFVILLNKLLDEYKGVKGKLAQKLDIKPSTLTPWLQGKIDPASLEILVFSRIAKVTGYTTDSLAQLLKIVEIEKQQKISQEQFKKIIEQILINQSREQLGKRLRISQYTISNWLNPKRNVHPEKIPVNTFAAVATERGWTIERLLAYLNLKEDEEIEEDVLALIQSKTKQLSLPNRVKLLSWLSGDFEKELSKFNLPISNAKDRKSLSDKKVCIILEKEDLAIASNYLQNLYLQTNLKPENISIATIVKLPPSLEEFDTIVFDLDLYSTEIVSVIEKISFDRNILVFAPPDLSEEVRSTLANQVTEIVVKPIDWESLKDKPYFR